MCKYHSTTFFIFLFSRLTEGRSFFLSGSLHVFEIKFLFEFASELYKNILDVFALLGRALHVCEVLFIAELIDPVLRHLSLVVEVALVPDQEENRIFL